MKIYVVKNSKLLGILKEDASRFTFIYNNSIKKDAFLPHLSNKINKADELFSVFENLIPESEIVKNIVEKKNIKTIIEVLLYLDNINGSFEFYSEKDFAQLDLSEVETFNYIDVCNDILQSDYTFPNILKDFVFTGIDDNKLHPIELDELATKTTMGLSGVQYKFAVALDFENKKIKLTDSKNDLYFIKPYNKHRATFVKKGDNSNYLPFLLINEHLFMTLARDFGFKIPYNAIVKEGIDYHYIVKRFDNYNGIKIDHIDFLAYIGKQSIHKYDVKLTELTEKVFTTLSKEDMLTLFKFLIFSIIIGHGDLHAKNLSMIYKTNDINETELILSPFYDIATTKIYGKNTHDNDIGINLTARKKAHITKDDLIIIANKMNISEDEAINIIEDFSKKFCREFKSDYIDKLPTNIKALSFHRLNGYGHDTLEVVLNKYLDKKKMEIKRYLKVEIDDVKNSATTNSIWK